MREPRMYCFLLVFVTLVLTIRTASSVAEVPARWTPDRIVRDDLAQEHFSAAEAGFRKSIDGGEVYTLGALARKTPEHKDAIRLDPNSTLVCARCHNPHAPVGVHADHYRQQPPRFGQAGECKTIESK